MTSPEDDTEADAIDDKVEQIIERIVLHTICPDNASAADIRAAIREFSKTALRLNDLEIPSDAVIDEIAGELIEWHAPRPDEPGWNPDLADAPAEQRLMARHRRPADTAEAFTDNVLKESEQELAQEREANREQAGRQDIQRAREDAARRRSRGDHEGADFLEKWIADQERPR